MVRQTPVVREGRAPTRWGDGGRLRQCLRDHVIPIGPCTSVRPRHFGSGCGRVRRGQRSCLSPYAIPIRAVAGRDVLEIETATRRAAEIVRPGGGPCLLEPRTRRLGQTRGQDDPVKAITRTMHAGGELSRSARRSLRRAVRDEVSRALNLPRADQRREPRSRPGQSSVGDGRPRPDATLAFGDHEIGHRAHGSNTVPDTMRRCLDLQLLNSESQPWPPCVGAGASCRGRPLGS